MQSLSQQWDDAKIDRRALCRTADRARPQWLDFCVDRLGPGADIAGFFDRLRTVALHRVAPDIDPIPRMHRVAELACLQHSPANLHQDLLFADLRGAPPPAFATIDVKVLLVQRSEGPYGPVKRGLVATLRLSLIEVPEHRSGEALTFVAAPASSLLLDIQRQDGAAQPPPLSFDAALFNAAAAVKRHLGTNRLQVALMWDLIPPGDVGLLEIMGNSAGAVFALAGLYLLREHIADEALRTDLGIIEWPRTAITAALAGSSGDELACVADLGAKYRAWQAEGNLVRSDRVFVGDEPRTTDDDLLVRCHTLAGLVRAVADDAGGRVTRAQEPLLAMLLADGPLPQSSEEQIGAVNREAEKLDAANLRQYQLRRYSELCRPDPSLDDDERVRLFRLDLDFVELTIAEEAQPDQEDRSDAPEKNLPRRQPRSCTSLRQLLTEGELAPGAPQAWLLLGQPGGGKTTVMQHLEVTAIRDALRHLHTGQRDDPAAEPELCLWFSLKDYKASESGPVEWLKAQWQLHGPKHPSFDDLLAHPRARGDLRLRLLFDGINEIDAASPQQHEAAVKTLVEWAVDQHRKHHMRPALFSVREHMVGTLGSSSYKVRKVWLQRWRIDQMEDYVRRRIPPDGGAVWAAIRDDRDGRLREFSAVPINLAFQCSLEPKLGRPATNRAELFAGKTWDRLQREDEKDNLEGEGLLAQRDRARLRDPHFWRNTLLELPDQGTLISGLDQQGLVQLESAGGDSGLAVSTVQDKVATWLLPEPGRREAWLQAVQDLGIARLDALTDKFSFRHQLWLEFFAGRAFNAADGRSQPLPDGLKPDLGLPIDKAIADAGFSSLALPQRSKWEEVLKLAAQAAPDPWPLLQRLMRVHPALAGRVAAGLADAGQDNRLEALRAPLLEICTGPTEPDLRIRVEAGLALGELGDTLRYVQMPVGGKPICLLPRQWVEVKQGDYGIGSAPGDADAHNWERPVVQVPLKRYWMAYAPVTNAEYRCFVEAKGYLDERWWGKAAREWLRLRYAIMVKPRANDEPAYWDDARFNNPLQPVVGVSLYEALAYARWLSEAGGHSVRLPTEAEWEAAVRGKQRRTYAWGEDEPDAQRVNWLFSGLQRTSPVGAFPRSNTPEGLVDAAGNCRNWTTSEFSDKGHDAGRLTGLVDAESELPRAVRGIHVRDADPRNVRAACRSGEGPCYISNALGFRLVSAAPFLDLGP